MVSNKLLSHDSAVSSVNKMVHLVIFTTGYGTLLRCESVALREWCLMKKPEFENLMRLPTVHVTILRLMWGVGTTKIWHIFFFLNFHRFYFWRIIHWLRQAHAENWTFLKQKRASRGLPDGRSHWSGPLLLLVRYFGNILWRGHSAYSSKIP